jgi:hypothetical protein
VAAVAAVLQTALCIAVLFAGLLGWLAWRVGASWDSVVFGYFWAAIAVGIAIQRIRRQRSSRS